MLGDDTKQQPKSIRDAAKLVGRDYKQVHRNLSDLENIGVITFGSGEAGQAKTPKLAYDGLEIDIPVARQNGDVGTTAP
ncbi:hypothetical protein C479_13633 [Halovivax asiaticus JCM 14624]|uniref:Transcriptional regulator n=1 Tax=Halovivax asiaticus JCM 14624 TaxID=1227490 RepID=M0BFE4_9EURY|nr:hypothetical protein [Halovivax asiaticus]ELZ08384.1 hypothetical protein C479_13633 [Halovivax asiaticus JCM 14624]